MKRSLLTAVGLLLLVLVLFFSLTPGFLEQRMNLVERADNPAPSEAARKLHASLVIGDLHTDSTLWQRDLREHAGRGHVDLPRLRQGNVALQVFTSVTSSPSGQNYEKNASDASDNITLLALTQRWPVRTWDSLAERALFQASRLQRIAEENPEQLQLVRNQAELNTLMLRRAEGETVVGAIIGTEGSHALDGKLETIDRLYEAGFRMMGLQHFFDNRLGGSLHGESGAGLTDFGAQAVDRMLQRNIIIDVAHSSEAVVRDVLARTDSPLVVSHTGFQGHCASPRNISDELMQAIAARGGVIGVGYWDAAVCATSVSAIVEAMRYGIDLVGADHVALGSDFDGTITAPLDTSELVLLTDEMLRQGISESDIRKIMGLNLLRLLQQGLPGD